MRIKISRYQMNPKTIELNPRSKVCQQLQLEFGRENLLHEQSEMKVQWISPKIGQKFRTLMRRNPSKSLREVGES